MSTVPITSRRSATRATRRMMIKIAPAAVGVLLIASCGSDTAEISASTRMTSATTPATPEPAPTIIAEPTTTAAPATTTFPATAPSFADRLASWSSAPRGPAPVDDIPRFLPTASIAPAGVPVRADAEGGSSAQATYTQVFADADRDILLTLQSQPGGIDVTPSEMRQPVTIDGWDDAYRTDGGLRLVALDLSGVVRLAGTGIDMDQAVSMIETMQRRAAGTPGWDLSIEFVGLVEINGAWNDSAGQRFVTWFDGDRVVAQMLLSPAHTDVITQALGPAFEQVDVNGAQGWLNENTGRRALVWSPDGTTIVVLGIADERIDPLAVARSTTALIAADYESATTTEIPSGVGDGCDGSLFC
jgi:hypothetical protein